MKIERGWMVTVFVISLLLFLFAGVQDASACPGRIFNPITDVDWVGAFPIRIGGVTVASFGQEDTETVTKSPICFCEDRPPPLNAIPGISVSFWEPVRILEVVRDPYCGYPTELDPLWNNPELAALLTPEAFLFANPESIAVCATDCAAATAGFPIDTLFWCGGCWGGFYPLNGALSAAKPAPSRPRP